VIEKTGGKSFDALVNGFICFAFLATAVVDALCPEARGGLDDLRRECIATIDRATLERVPV